MNLVGTFAFLALLALSGASPVNNTAMSYVEKHEGPCYYESMKCAENGGTCCPVCDADGYYMPKQCSSQLGCCWCVDVHTGKKLPNTETMAMATLDCGKNMYCDSGWYYYEGRCFLFVRALKTWSEAEKHCQLFESNLASVHSYKEYHFLQMMTVGLNHVLEETWLGAHDLAKPGFWMWCDGSKFYNEVWCNRDEAEKSGSCLKMNCGFDKKWAAGDCGVALPFMCSKWSNEYYYNMKDKEGDM